MYPEDVCLGVRHPPKGNYEHHSSGALYKVCIPYEVIYLQLNMQTTFAVFANIHLYCPKVMFYIFTIQH